MSAFLKEAKNLLTAHLGVERYTIIDTKDYPQDGTAWLDVELSDIRLRIMKEWNSDFWIDVASRQPPTKYYPVRNLLLLISGEPAEPSRVMVGHDMAHLAAVLAELLAHRAEVAHRLQPEHLADTERQLEHLSQQVMHPLLRQVTKPRS